MLNLFYDAPNEGNGGSQPPNDQSNETGGNNGNAPGLTQEQINEIIGQRVSRAKETAVKSLLQSLGVNTPDEIKAAMDELNTLKGQQLSERERLEARIKELEEAEAEKARLQQIAEAAKETITAQLEAMKQEITIPDYLEPLLANMDEIEQLRYLAQNKAKLSKIPLGDLNAGQRGKNSTQTPEQRAEELRKRFSGLRSLR
ncbi:MAG: hypothetical protein CUN56_00145 [Phototrophicales bacterium]|nr:MAG: hypothetical protein CUN56_00145 [Phototrophicales bacterium]